VQILRLRRKLETDPSTRRSSGPSAVSATRLRCRSKQRDLALPRSHETPAHSAQDRDFAAKHRSPSRQVHAHASSSRSAFASFRSAVSKPSVNQP
jgi:hypothetical protein